MSNQTILLIDYDPASITRTATPLTKAGYQVEVAKDGLSGLAAFERMKPALVLVEAMLPRKHGFEVCQEIKAKPEGKSTPVLITTAVCRGRKYRMDALQIYGCDEYIEKPITDDELLSLIARFIEQAKQTGEEIQQDLSAAIDTADVDVPVAIESMDDDELEAKIDALLMGSDAPAEGEQVVAPPVAQAPTAVAEKPIEAPAEPTPVVQPSAIPVAKDSETDRQLDAMLSVEPTQVDHPVEPVVAEQDAAVEALPVQAPAVAEEPAVESVADPLIGDIEPQPVPEQPTEAAAETVAQPAKQEWTETSSQEKRGGSKVIVFGVAAVALLGVAGFFAFQQGWIGGGSGPEPAPVEAADNTRAVVNPETTNAGLAPSFQGPVLDFDDAPSIESETPAELEPEPVAAEPEPVEPEPVVPPKPTTFKPRSAADKKAARDRQARADRALRNAAGSLQTQLLSDDADPAAAQDESVKAIDIDDDDLIGTPVPPKARRGELYALANVDTSPVPVRFEQPVYDDAARRLKQQGEVIVEVLIDETGEVAEARLVQEIPNSRLNDATLRAARRWSYRPAVKDGVPVKVWKSERIVFELD
jgi:TonB family protein